MKELTVNGNRYRIREETPPKGREPSDRFVLEHISTGQRSKHGKAEFYEQARLMLRTSSAERCIRYIEEIERVPVENINETKK
ncbi:hypothetical protein [Nitratifractor salsuginis]|uniref:Uncharacterized protein n=1 Tax=Nitratifractor salsuginis (strain DSM 16511 / JCM 12458 / E9I37-1) TaxID=749222 RepID=E6X1S8_NITSE|nr:hypothetical protein [Nitratifractor salsuginis]ADV47069.1 hypothetical protein Nitsa_1824 [Nitratifractor salsuginis DSM 16511]